jgi:hypothetical protein
VQSDILFGTIFLNISAITLIVGHINEKLLNLSICNSFGNAPLFRYIYKRGQEKISANIAFLFYKEIYMKYLLL